MAPVLPLFLVYPSTALDACNKPENRKNITERINLTIITEVMLTSSRLRRKADKVGSSV